MLDIPVGKISYFVYRIEFQVRGSTYICSFLWITWARKTNPDT